MKGQVRPPPPSECLPYNPCTDRWKDHFVWDEGRIAYLTEVGEVTAPTSDETGDALLLATSVSFAHILLMPMASATIEARVLSWPAARRLRLAERLVASVEGFATPKLAAAWETELEGRIADIQSGRACGIPAEEVMAHARQRLHEARRVPSACRPRTHRLG